MSASSASTRVHQPPLSAPTCTHSGLHTQPCTLTPPSTLQHSAPTYHPRALISRARHQCMRSVPMPISVHVSLHGHTIAQHSRLLHSRGSPHPTPVPTPGLFQTPGLSPMPVPFPYARASLHDYPGSHRTLFPLSEARGRSHIRARPQHSCYVHIPPVHVRTAAIPGGSQLRLGQRWVPTASIQYCTGLHRNRQSSVRALASKPGRRRNRPHFQDPPYVCPRSRPFERSPFKGRVFPHPRIHCLVMA